MKKIIFSLFILSLCSTVAVQAQKKLKEGKIIFEITYPDVELDQQTMAMLPDASTMYFKNEKSRVEIKMAMGTTVVISDNKAQTATTLMDFMGNKMAIHMTKEDIEKEKNGKGKPKVTITDEKKEIAGYTCTKAIVTPEDSAENAPFEIWFTKEIEAQNSMRSGMEGVDGFLMEFKTRQNNMTMKMSCKSVKEEKVDDALFVIPEGYKPVTMEELKEMRGRK